jgi:adenylate cyclase
MAIQELTPALDAELLAEDVPPVRFGIGLHAGEAVAAHLGGGKRRQYAVVGDTVNVGSRLCSVAGGEEIVCSWEVLSRVSSPPCMEEVGPVELKGVTRHLRLFRIRVSEAAAEPEPAEARRD